jgi:hypothetical protein
MSKVTAKLIGCHQSRLVAASSDVASGPWKAIHVRQRCRYNFSDELVKVVGIMIFVGINCFKDLVPVSLVGAL